MDSISSTYYRSIDTLPLSRFIDVMVDDNIFGLVITGDSARDDLLATWEDIKLQYADAIKDHEYRLMNSLYREVAVLEITYKQILTAIDTLRKYYCKEIADELNKILGSAFKFDHRFPEDYEGDLQRSTSRSKGTLMRLHMSQAQLKTIEDGKRGKDDKPTRGYYTGVLISLSDHAKYPIGESITVFEFCERIRRLNEHFEKMNNNGNRR